jgi:hypothetical protein
MKAYHITQWNPLYEKADTRKTDYMGWFCKQTKLVGIGIGKTMREPYPRNAILYGIWTIIETLASQSAVNERGWLIRGGVALDAESMADLVPTVPPTAFAEAVEWFLQPKIGWLECVECPHLNGTAPELFPTETPKNAAPTEATGKNSRSVPAPTEATGKNSATDRQTDRHVTDIRRERERENSGFTSKGEARKAQLQQFASAQARKRELEALTEELSLDQEEELKKMRVLVKMIQKKQRAGDFTPVENKP